MRDGARLKADVFRPYDDGKFPAILNLGPYQKDKLWIVPENLAELLESCLEERPERRPPGFKEVLARLPNPRSATKTVSLPVQSEQGDEAPIALSTKPVAEMSEAEVHAWALSIAEKMVADAAKRDA